MQDNETDPVVATDTDSDDQQIDQRDVRALTQYLTVLDDYGPARAADSLYVVVSESGSEYLVDTEGGVCECPDHQQRGVRCKHLRRVAFATGERPIPLWVRADAVDPQLGMHLSSGGPRVAATDGGVSREVAEQVPDEEIDARSARAATSATEDRPDDCNCGPVTVGEELPCWPCYRDGFETVAPEDDED